LTIFVNSCDAYEDCWIPFFKLFDKYWPECNLPIILNTETKTFGYSNLNIICPAVEKKLGKMDWGFRFIESLKFVNTKYVLLFIDDFFISSPVNIEALSTIIEAMKKETASCTYLNPRENHISITTNPEIIQKLHLKQKYLFSLQVAIWDKSKLLTFLRAFENPWSTERFGSRRAQILKANFYCYNPDYQLKNGPILTYPDTGGIGRGQWVKSVVDEILIPNGIIVDTSFRGFWPGYGVPPGLLTRLINKLKRFPKSLHSYLDLFYLVIYNTIKRGLLMIKYHLCPRKILNRSCRTLKIL